MMIARWHIDAKFGHKQDVIDSIKRWQQEIGSRIGWEPERTRILTGSVGDHESTVITEIAVDDLAALDQAWNKLGEIPEHAEWSRTLEPHMVSGSTYWTVDRVV